MYIDKVLKDKNNKYKIYSGDNYLFSLYEKELAKFCISEGVLIEDDKIDYISKDIINKRAKERALYLLESKPYTEYMLRKKLVLCGYTEAVIDQVIDFLNIYNYIDDIEYSSMYIRTYADKKSKKQIIKALLSKGININVVKDLIEEYYSEYTSNNDDGIESPEEECLKKQFNKYIQGKDLCDPIIKQKVFRHFYGKGFTADSINKLISFT